MGINNTVSITTETAMGFPTATDDGTPYIFRTNSKGLYSKTASGSVLSLANVYRMGCRVHFKAGFGEDPQNAGYILLPNGK